jgi:signal transduction histidine kinase/CheY-like chemotaxis protein
MWQTLVWWRGLQHGDLARRVDDLRTDSFHLVLRVATASYLIWHFARTYEKGTQGLEHWPLVSVVAVGLGGSYLLWQRGSRFAIWYFLLSSALAIAAAVWLLGATEALILYPLLALVAVVLLHPLAGVLVTAFWVTLLVGLRAAGLLAVLGHERLLETALASLLTVIAAWALARNMAVAVDWSDKSHAEAWRKTEEARANRAELVQALKQLDHAYSSLRRANAALELAWKAADDAERAKSEFVTNISHELRTPLNLIIGFSEMMLTAPETYRVPLPPAYRGDLNAIYHSAGHLLTLTNDVIDLARVGMGRLALLREPVELAQVITDACTIVRQYVDAKGLSLRIDIQPALPLLHLDRLRIRQVLLNLLTNAARFTQRGGITVSAALDADGRQVLVQVADTGRGIAPDDLPKVFKEFYSSGGDSTLVSREPGGVGLGLPLSRRFIELHGGEMGVDSRLDAGSTFWFRLPTLTSDGIGQSERRPAAPISGRPPADERLLVLVGADAPARELLQRHLAGFRLLPAIDLQSAVSAAVETHALAIVTDLDVPSEQAVPVPIFRLPLPHSERLAARLGAAAYLTKPVTRATLYHAITQVAQSVRTILIVDDDPRFLRLLARMLRAAPDGPGYTLLSAHNGREALAIMEATRPDLVLLDFIMSDLSGAETLAAMRAQPALAGVPVILISAQDQLKALFPLPGLCSIARADGFQLEEMLGLIEAVLAVLRPAASRQQVVGSDA